MSVEDYCFERASNFRYLGSVINHNNKKYHTGLRNETELIISIKV
jgi:hypothetical protein